MIITNKLIRLKCLCSTYLYATYIKVDWMNLGEAPYLFIHFIVGMVNTSLYGNFLYSYFILNFLSMKKIYLKFVRHPNNLMVLEVGYYKGIAWNNATEWGILYLGVYCIKLVFIRKPIIPTNTWQNILQECKTCMKIHWFFTSSILDLASCGSCIEQ